MYKLHASRTVSVFLSVLAAVLAVTFLAYATSVGTDVSVSGTLTVTGASTFNGAATLGDDVADAMTANGYFTQLRIGTGDTFDDIGTVGADELGVEGAMEVNGIAYLDAGFIGTGSSTVTAAFYIGGNLGASSTLQATGAVRLFSTLRADDLTTLVTGHLSQASSTVVGNLTVSNNLVAS